jgi:hypothetical protein
MVIIPVLGWWRHEDYEFKANVSHIARPFQKQKTNKTKTERRGQHVSPGQQEVEHS